jgi:beta-phosphoglucomutase-like phosphatase (HAD superfamily)
MQMNTRKNIGWMRDLAFHYEAMRASHPDDKLMIVFDIDGTIFDVRHIIVSVLKDYDHDHGTRFFTNLGYDDITMPAHDIGTILREFAIPAASREGIAAWCKENYWSRAAILSSHKPFHGVLDVIRWFQLQPNTFVGLNSSRSESLRTDTLRILNTLGEEYHVKFDDALLSMNNGLPIPQGKLDGIRHFKDLGYRIVAVIDNEPENLEAIATSDPASEMLLLHADIIIKSSPARAGNNVMRRNFFDLTDLISRQQLPEHIEFVWHGVDDESILRQFLISSVQWAELHVRQHINSQDLILRRKPYAEMPPAPDENPARLDDFLYILGDAGRGVKLDLKDPGMTGRVLELLKASGFTDEKIWFTINMEEMRRGGLQLILDTFPKAIKQCPVDSLSQMMKESPPEARKYLGMLAHWGIDRFSVNWNTPSSRRIIIQLQNWGYDVNIYNVPDLEAFLQAALLLPKSITSFFNFPKWFYTGRSDEMEQPLRVSSHRLSL